MLKEAKSIDYFGDIDPPISLVIENMNRKVRLILITEILC